MPGSRPPSRASPPRSTQEALKSGHFMGVLGVLLRLQRICNHPGLVEPRLPESSYAAGPLQYRSAALVLKALDSDSWKVSRARYRPLWPDFWWRLVTP